MKEKELLEQLKQRFGAVGENQLLGQEDVQYLDERDKYEDLYSWNFEAFVEHYQLIKKYGLEGKLLEQLAWRIENLMDQNDLNDFKKSIFYSKFGKYKIIENAVINRESHD